MVDTLVSDAVPNGSPNADDILLQDDSVTEGNEQELEEDDEESDSEESTEVDKNDLEESDEDSEEDKQPDIPFDRPTVKAIKTEFPEFFTKFPALKEAFFREVEFTKIFPTIEDAKEAFEDNEAFSTLSDSVLAGDPSKLLESVEKTDSKAFKLLASSFLPALYKKDPEAYHEAVTPLFENLVRAMYKSSDENVKNSAINVARFFGWNDAEDIAEGKKTISKNRELSEEQKNLQQEKDSRTAVQFRESYSRVSTKIESAMTTLILRDFDPEKTFSKFMRNQLIIEVAKRIGKQLESDKGHLAVMGSRWKRAKLNGYTGDDESKIISTYLARAKSLIPSTSNKVRTLANGKRIESSDVRSNKSAPVKREVNGGRVPSKSDNGSPKDYRKMTDMEILNS